MENPTTAGYFFYLHVIPQKNRPVQPVCSVTPNQATSLLKKNKPRRQNKGESDITNQTAVCSLALCCLSGRSLCGKLEAK